MWWDSYWVLSWLQPKRCFWEGLVSSLIGFRVDWFILCSTWILGLKYLCNLFELRIHQWIASWPEKKNVSQCVILSSKDQVGYRYSFPRREGSIYVLIPGAPPLMCLGRGGTPVHCNSALCAVWNSNGLIDLLKGETIVKSGGLIGLIVV